MEPESNREPIDDAARSMDLCRAVRALCPGGAGRTLPLDRHADTLRGLRSQLGSDAPLALKFNGHKNCYAVLPPILQNCPRSYTLTLWVKVDHWSKTSDTVLFRCHTSHSESIELLMASDDRTEGRCYCSLRVDAGSRVHSEAGGQLLMTPGRWHLLSFSHRCSPYPHPPKMAVRVDGELFLDRELDYPFGSAGVECTWTVGSGLEGSVSSVALYPFEVGPRFIKFLFDAGPACPSLDCGVSNPQTSFDTGHCLVGSNFSRLEDYLDAGKSTPLFCFTAHHFLSGDAGDEAASSRSAKWAAFRSPGFLTNGFIELTHDCPPMNLTTVPACVGGCVVVGANGSDQMERYPVSHLWLAAGGVTLPLYLLWEYCGRTRPSNSEEASKSSQGGGVSFRTILKSCILETMQLLCSLIRVSADLKDALLQEHGFHVISISLGRLSAPDKLRLLDEALVDSCIDLVLAMGDDAVGGDGIVAALQGLLFDFSLWTEAKLSVRIYLLDAIYKMSGSIGTALYRSIGLQRVLDVVRLHVLEASDADAASGGADVVHRIVLSTVESARKSHQEKCQRLMRRNNSSVSANALSDGATLGNNGPNANMMQTSFVEAEILLRFLEESTRNETAEIAMHCLVHLRHESPDELDAVLDSSRFADTTAVYLICKRGLSNEVRHSVLHIFMWSVRRSHSLLLDDISELCEYMFRKGSSTTSGSTNSAQVGGGISVNSTPGGKRGSVTALKNKFTDGRKVKELLEALKIKKVVLQRLWRLVCMLAECLRRALRDGAWNESSAMTPGNVSNSDELVFDSFYIHTADDDLVKLEVPAPSTDPSSSITTAGTKNAVQHVSELLRHEGPLGQLDAWLLLPLMATMLPYMDTEKAEEVLASLGVILKTSEPQVLAFCVLADNLWVKYFVDLALMGLARADHPAAMSPGAMATSDLALDAFIQILIYQLQHFGNSAWLSWKAFHSHVRRDISASVGTTEISILRKCAGYLLQKLTKHQHDFSEDLLSCLSKIIVFLEEKRLCGNELIIVGGGLSGSGSTFSPGQERDLLDMASFMAGAEVTGAHVLKEDERQLLMQLCTFMSCLRTISQNLPLGKPTPFGFSEVRVLQPCVRVLLGSLSHVDLATADLLCLELRSIILHSADRWMFYDPEYYKLFIVDVFGGLQTAIHKKNIALDVKERYRTAILTIAHIFLELRRVSLEQSGYISPHVIPTLDAVGITEGYFEADVVLSLLQKYLETARDSNVSAEKGGKDEFGDDDYDMMGLSPPADSSRLGSAKTGIVDPFEEIISFDMLAEPVASGNPVSVDLIDFLDTNSPDVAPQSPSVEHNDNTLTSLKNESSSGLLLDFDSTATEPLNTSMITATTSSAMESSQEQDSKIIAVSDQELYFRDWLQRRRGIISERIDSGRTRIERFYQAVALSEEATRKCWRRLHRKVQSESFLEDQYCSWKLGISHEGHFPGRRRVILRPRFLEGGEPEKEYTKSRPYVCGEEHLLNLVESDEDEHESNSASVGQIQGDKVDSISSPSSNSRLRRIASANNSVDFAMSGEDSMRTLLEMAKSGIIADPIAGLPPDDLNLGHQQQDGEDDDENIPKHSSELLVGFGASRLSSGKAVPPSSDQSWGLIDADDDEDGGYGVIGYVPAVDSDHDIVSGEVKSSENAEIGSNDGQKTTIHDSAHSDQSLGQVAGDMLFDVSQLETDARQGRVVNTGACLPGTRRVTANHGSTVIFDTPVTLITASGNYIGNMSFTNSEIYYVSTHSDGEDGGHLLDAAAVTLMPRRRIRRRKWLVERIAGVYLRTYRLRESAIEVFFRRGKHRNFFVDFGSAHEDLKKRNAFAKALMSIAPQAAMKQWPHSTFYRVIHEHGMQERWLNGHISNFDYIMFLNTMAGRSYNDLCQYPVFPWVLSQYNQSSIDLNDPSNYRDLSKPVGALNPSRLADFIERYKSFGDSEIPPFMYGSHYSTMVGVVLHYLVRLQPFASLHQEIQNGRFDVPDRLFSSIPRTWDHNYNMLSEVKELTPEFFTLPDFLRNVNNFDLGRVQDGNPVCDVELPPWAKSPEDFIRINREALEGDYVSSHLHEWIDLIFGYKQRGQAAVEANNVFYYLTYSGTVDREKLDDVTKKCVDLQIAHFGQCPNQLFGSPHPQKRINTPPIPRPLRKCFNSSMVFGKSSEPLLAVSSSPDCPDLSQSNNKSTAEFVLPSCIEEALVANSCASVIPGPPTSAVIAIKITGKKLTCVRDNGVVDMYRYGFTESTKTALLMYAKMHPAGQTARRGSALKGNQPNAVLVTDSVSAHPYTSARRDHPPEAGSVPDIISFDAFDSTDASGVDMLAHRSDVPSPVRSELVDLKGVSSFAPFMDWSTKDHIVISAESVIGDSVTVPRLPVAHIRPGGSISKLGASDLLNRIRGSHLVHFLRLDSLVLTAGRTDGMVSVRELDSTSGEQLAGGDFRGHKFQVSFLASDSIPNGHSSLVASCDISGQVLVWTVSVSSHQGFNRHIVSRRPQRLFRCFPGENCCDISWQMGIVIAGSKHCVSVFSIERNERFRIIDVRINVLEFFFKKENSAYDSSSDVEKIISNISCRPDSADINTTNGVSNSGRFNENRLWESSFGCVVSNIVCCDYGSLVTSIEYDCSKNPSFLQPPGTSNAKFFLVLAFAINGTCTGRLLLQSKLTCLDCPGRGSIITIGTSDGCVIFANSISLEVLYQINPNERCVRLSSSGDVMSSRTTDTRAPRSGGLKRDVHPGDITTSIPSSSIITIKVGPKLDRPTFAAASNSNGQIYLLPLPDFVKYEKMHATSTLSQIVSAPIQAVKGTIQSAQNFTILAGDAAGSLAQNAKGIAGDAIGEAQDFLKKMNKSKIFRGVGSFFGGGGGGSSPSDNNK